VSSAEMVLGTPLHLPGELLNVPKPPPARLPIDPPRTCTYAEVAARPPAHLAQAKFVYIRRGGRVPPLEPLYVGPCEVIRKSAKTFTVRLGNKEEAVSVDRLKAHSGPGPVQSASPPLRGRPPARPRVQPASS
jgi:hypothetical protein